MGFRGGINLTSADIPDGSITEPKLADGAVTSPKVGDGAVTRTKLTDGVVDTAKLADGSVASAKIAISLRSDNYSPGLAGWAINRDSGDVEFADGTFRGLVEAAVVLGSLFQTAATGRRIEAGPNVKTGDTPIIAFHGSVAQNLPGMLFSVGDSTDSSRHSTSLRSPQRVSTDDVSQLNLFSAVDNGETRIDADSLLFQCGDIKKRGLATYFNLTGPDGASVGSQWQMIDGAFHARNRFNSAWIPVRASGFEVQSDRALKSNVRAPDYQFLPVVDAAPVRQWEHVLGEPPNEQRVTEVGVMAEDLPEHMQRRTVSGTMVSSTSLMGVLWGAVRELTARLAVLEGARR